ncbi:MAG: acetyl-CoA carboxylase biotin carboxyl carrier protein [Chitinophagales bacterium]|nr:acetyl-CoA carboxylase biotin carboxyl carrier protein [Chitinophagales bacterium]
MEFKQIQELIKLVNKTNISELKISESDFSITIRSNEFNQASRKSDPVQQIHVSAPPVQPISTPVEQNVNSPAISVPSQSESKQAEKPSSQISEEDKYVVFRSPMIGTFYRRPGPDKDIFVNVDDTVKTGDVICIIEAMKLFNEIEFEGEGRIVKVLAEDATPVEYDQPLFLIEPLG